MKILFIHAKLYTLPVLLSVLLVSGISHARAEALDFNATILNGTCDITAPSSVVFNQTIAGNFSQEGDTSEVRPLTITLSNCTEGGPLNAAVQVNGHMGEVTGMESLFRDSGSSAQHIGIMVKDYDYKGPIKDFYSAPGTVVHGEFTHEQAPGESLSGKQLSYSIGLTRGMAGNLSSVIGHVQATLEFVFVYH
ncbi:P pilus assembly protein, pilin FimA [Serratia fonticola]|uniref:P pilus assembly protein, pilin FimA n=1 Tax=Serratia fonticola TaxID=47917 RepID=A0A0F7HEX4_SERFO|nr:fimbrial protein [Serratia fonticola]AKG70894.1 hypothetical protein WN53_18145 [Serratia fonticola]CAI1689853.1 P pilus assembly protein, pilin FimA [Serratia fonticola]VTR39369.1 P pilus assembly protein, pilin FimA [Serratia fonticola]